jgi:hypothetical protein
MLFTRNNHYRRDSTTICLYILNNSNVLTVIRIRHIDLLALILPDNLMSAAYTNTKACLINVAYIARKNPVLGHNLMILLKLASEDVRIVCVLSLNCERLTDENLILWVSLYPP